MSYMYKKVIPCTQCGQPAIARQLCRPHYNEARTAGKLSEHQGLSVHDAFFLRVDKSGDCWLWMGAKNEYGYGMFTEKGRRPERAHRFSFELAGNEIPDGMVLMHSCDNPACVNPEHLTPGTRGDNNRDCAAKGRKPSGEGHWRAKLTQEEVKDIKESTESGPVLCARYGVAQSTISRIKTGARRKGG